MQYYTVHKRGKHDRTMSPAVKQAVTHEDAEDIAANLRAHGYTVAIVPVLRAASKEDNDDLD